MERDEADDEDEEEEDEEIDTKIEEIKKPKRRPADDESSTLESSRCVSRLIHLTVP